MTISNFNCASLWTSAVNKKRKTPTYSASSWHTSKIEFVPRQFFFLGSVELAGTQVWINNYGLRIKITVSSLLIIKLVAARHDGMPLWTFYPFLGRIFSVRLSIVNYGLWIIYFYLYWHPWFFLTGPFQGSRRAITQWLTQKGVTLDTYYKY